MASPSTTTTQSILRSKDPGRGEYFKIPFMQLTKIYLGILLLLLTGVTAQAQRPRKQSQMKDSVMLDDVTVIGKSKTQQVREGAFSVNAIDVRSVISSLNSLNSIVDRTAGVKVREEGGVGSDFDLSI